jgi:hypothetical protein
MYCKKLLKETADGTDNVSHGACPECAKREMAKLLAKDLGTCDTKGCEEKAVLMLYDGLCLCRNCYNEYVD